MLRALARAFGVDPDRMEAIVAAYENPDRLALIEERWQEAGCGDADKAWLIQEVKQLRAVECSRLAGIQREFYKRYVQI